MKKNKTILKILVSAVLFVLIFRKINMGSFVETFKSINFWYIPLILPLFFLNYLISSVRWKSLLIFENTKEVSVKYLTSLYFIGSFFNNFMPTSIGGDVYKIYRLGKKINSNTNAFTATFMERFTGMIALVLISYLGLVKTFDFWLNIVLKYIPSNKYLELELKVLLYFGFWICAILFFSLLKILGKRVKKVREVRESLMLYKNRKKELVIAFITSFMVQFMAILSQYLVFKSLGVDLPFDYAFFIFPVIILASFFIPSLNGIGVQDALYVQFFGIVGITAPIALGASIIYHLFRLIVSLAGGVVYALGKTD